MATLEDKEQYITVAADKLLRRKTNLLSVGGNVYSEQFPRELYISLDHVYNTVPTSSTNFATPDYVDYTTSTALGGVGTRYQEIRLHPVIISGINGPQTIQSFLAVSAPPASDSTTDINAVRIQQIIPPDFSPQRTNAADSNPATRGFELALYPAMSSAGIGTPLVADTSNGPIPITADPSSVNGIGDGYSWWYVDYDAGAVLFTGAPLNGSTGIVNPNNVYGDIDGYQVDPIANPDSARLTMFATFYQYTGTRQGDIETIYYIGDGINTFGNFDGTTDIVFSTAIGALNGFGGTIVVKNGTYTFSNPVTIPANVSVVSDGSNPIIYAPNYSYNSSAFIISSSNITLSGFTIHATLSSTPSFAVGNINIQPGISNTTISNINLINNTIYSNSNLSSLAIVSGFPNPSSLTISNLYIQNNIFTYEAGTTSPSYITSGVGGISGNFSISLTNANIINNVFDNTSSSPSIAIQSINQGLNGYAINSLTDCTISYNKASNSTISLPLNTTSSTITRFYAEENSVLSFTLTATSGSAITFSKNNIINSAGLTLSSLFTDVYLNGNNINGILSSGFNTNSTLNTLDINGNVAIGSAYAGVISAPSNGLLVEGSLGLGTSTPLNTLDAYGSVAIGTYAGNNAAPSEGLIVSGNVGIGTSAPGAYSLNVVGNSYFSNNVTIGSGGLTVTDNAIIDGGTLTTTQTGSGFEIFRETWNDPNSSSNTDAIRHLIFANTTSPGTGVTSTNYFIQRQTLGSTNLGYIGFLNSSGVGVARGTIIGYGNVPTNTASSNPAVGLYVDSNQLVSLGIAQTTSSYILTVGPSSTLGGIYVNAGTVGSGTGLYTVGGGIYIDFSGVTSPPPGLDGLTIFAPYADATIVLNGGNTDGQFIDYTANSTLKYRLGNFYESSTYLFQLMDDTNNITAWQYSPTSITSGGATQPIGQTTFGGDITATGGFRQTLGPATFTGTVPGSSTVPFITTTYQTYTVSPTAGAAEFIFVPSYAGSIVGISAYVYSVSTTLISVIQVYINGTPAASLSVNTSTTGTFSTQIIKDTTGCTFAAGSTITISLVNASSSANTAQIATYLTIEM